MSILMIKDCLMSIIRRIFIGIGIVALCSVHAETDELVLPIRSKKDISVSYTEEKLNGDTFVHRQDWDHVTGLRKNIWLINGKEVDEEQYKKMLYKAEKQHIKKERSYYEQRQSSRHERVQQIAMIGSLALLERVVADVESILKKCDDTSLKPYFQFSQKNGISQDILDRLQDELLPQARKCVRTGVQQDLALIHQLYAELETMPDKLDDFFLCSIEHAIKHADNVQLLKKWLTLVS